MTKLVCLFPQYYACKKNTCPLYHKCSELKFDAELIKKKSDFLRIYANNRTFNETRQHQKLYSFYNSLWGNQLNKQRQYNKEHHEQRMEYQRKYRAKLKPNAFHFESVLFDGLCTRNCFECEHTDCVLPIWSNKKEYDSLYYKKNRDIKIARSKAYYETHKQQRSEYSKNYHAEHREEILKKQRERWKKNKDEYNKKRREKRQKTGVIL